MEPKAPLPAHITCVGNLYHQIHGDNATAVPTSWERPVKSRVRPFTRDVEVDWQFLPVDIGNAGLVIVANQIQLRSFRPTPEEAAADAAKVVEVSFDGERPHVRVRPGEDCRFEPADTLINLRCAKGSTIASVTVYPE